MNLGDVDIEIDKHSPAHLAAMFVYGELLFCGKVQGWPCMSP